MRINHNQLRTVRRVMFHPGIDESRMSGAGYCVESCVRAGFMVRKAEGSGDGSSLYLTPRGRAAAANNRQRVASGAFTGR